MRVVVLRLPAWLIWGGGIEVAEMVPVAGRVIKVGHEFRQPGEPVPEALGWNPRVVERLMSQNHLKVYLSGTTRAVTQGNKPKEKPPTQGDE
jgi:hypothetical protein